MKAEWIALPAEPHDSLVWSDALARAEKAERILWDVRLGIERPSFPLEDAQRFEALALGLKQFSNTVWPRFAAATDGLCLYRGAVHADPDALAHYLQMLAHKLPDELEVFLLFDERPIASKAEALSLLSRERFPHFVVALRSERLPRDGLVWDESGQLTQRTLPTSVGLVLPEQRDAALLARFDALLETVQAKVVLEAFLTEEWEGLDQLLVLENSLTPQGVRKLKGFEAAGGEIVWVENRGRGI